MSDKIRLPTKIVVAVVGALGLGACPSMTNPPASDGPACQYATCDTDAAWAIEDGDGGFDVSHCNAFATDGGTCTCTMCPPA